MARFENTKVWRDMVALCTGEGEGLLCMLISRTLIKVCYSFKWQKKQLLRRREQRKEEGLVTERTGLTRAESTGSSPI